MIFDTAEKLGVIEHLIERYRWAKNQPRSDEHHTFEVLKAIALDLRAREPGTAEKVIVEMERRINAALAGSTALGLPSGALIAVGQETIARWATLRQGLEKLTDGLPRGAARHPTPRRVAVFSHAPASDLDEQERMELFETLERFRGWCRKWGHEGIVRELPADPEGHAERRASHGK